MKEKKHLNKLVIIGSIICSLVLLGVLGSYAYFMGNLGITKNEEVSTETGSMSLIFSDGNNGIVGGSLEFGGSIEKTFNIQNNGTISVTAKINWDNLTNTYLNGSLTYTLSYSETPNGEYTELITNKNVPRSETPDTLELARNITIPENTTYYYKLKITLNYLDDVDQTADLKAMLSTQFSIEEQEQNVLMARVDNTKIWAHKADIKTIVFEPSITEKPNTVYTYDISQNGNGRVMGKLVPDTVDTTKYTLYIQADQKIYANENSSSLFQNFTNLETIDGMKYFDTSNVTNMVHMFTNCKSLTTLDLSDLDTGNVTTMQYMFLGCSGLTALDLSNLDTSNVTDMIAVFDGCRSLTTLDVSNFDTSNVASMVSMFRGCNSLISLDLSSFDTSNVTTMQHMFLGCSGLISLNLNNLDTNNVTNMYGTFQDCSSLKTLDLSDLDTGNVTTMSYMFSGCNGLTSLDLSNFDTGNVTVMSYMFNMCTNLKTLDLSNFNTSKVITMQCMFNMYVENDTSISQLKEIKGIEKFNVEKLLNTSGMFQKCSNLTATITIRGTCNSYSEMFLSAATNSGASITVNYTADTSTLVNSMIATKSSNSNVKKGVQVA